MLALTCRQPYASLIMMGLKTWELRAWKFPFERCEILIHAASQITLTERKVAYHPVLRGLLKQHWPSLRDMPRGVILGSVTVLDCGPAKLVDPRSLSVIDRLAGWWDEAYAWTLCHPHRWSSQPKVGGQKGLWEYQGELEDA